MSRMLSVDVVIFGGGIVGLTLAAALLKTDLRIVVIEPNSTNMLLSDIPDVRVSALNRASEHVFQHLSVWDGIVQRRCATYHNMKVWEKDSFGSIQFQAQKIGQANLGHIVENRVIQLALLDRLRQESQVTFLSDACQTIAFGEQESWITLNSGQALTAKLVVGADGANSWLRQFCEIPLTFRDYGHHAIVATIRCTEPHQLCAQQIFSSDGVLAFLPLSDLHLCSIVWSVSPEHAESLMALSPTDFERALSVSFDQQLGLCSLVSERQSFPLTMRYARDFVVDRVALVGDAAHTIHPLAGQGVNLGIMDAACLAECIQSRLNAGVDFGEKRHLRHYERWRKAEAAKLIVAMQGFKETFSGSHPVKQLFRDVTLCLIDRLPMVKDEFMMRALGVKGELPWLAKPPIFRE